MKEIIIESTMNSIKKYYDYSDIKLLEIKYGLETLYLTITKTIILSFICLLLGLIKELGLLFLFYGILRITGFGLHTKKSYECWIFSIIAFILLPYLIKTVIIPCYILYPLLTLFLFFIIKYAPADTEKRPLIRKKKRVIYKIITILITIIYIITIIYSNQYYIQNTLFFSIMLEVFVIHPMSYKLLDLPYNNYLKYINNKEGGSI